MRAFLLLILIVVIGIIEPLKAIATPRPCESGTPFALGVVPIANFSQDEHGPALNFKLSHNAHAAALVFQASNSFQFEGPSLTDCKRYRLTVGQIAPISFGWMGGRALGKDYGIPSLNHPSRDASNIDDIYGYCNFVSVGKLVWPEIQSTIFFKYHSSDFEDWSMRRNELFSRKFYRSVGDTQLLSGYASQDDGEHGNENSSRRSDGTIVCFQATKKLFHRTETSDLIAGWLFILACSVAILGGAYSIWSVRGI